jgi:hypothetical protein
MKRGVSLFVVWALAVGYTLAGCSVRAQAQSIEGKWVHQGPRGVSVLEFFPGDKRLVGPVRGHFHHSIILDDGRVCEGDGHYVLRFARHNKGWLVLHFSDGHVTREHEHTFGPAELRLEHHGVLRTYIRQ